MKFTPYWLDISPPGPDRSATEVGGQVDVAVVGAGLTGLSAALHLARKGAKVAVLEKETVACGASGRHDDAIDTIEKLVADEATFQDQIR
jgi:flavin-dependent dehydrogenase